MPGRLVALYVANASQLPVPAASLPGWIAAHVKGLPARCPPGLGDSWVVLSGDGSADIPWLAGQTIAQAVATPTLAANPIVAYAAATAVNAPILAQVL
jgi:hypothetical protein